MRHFTTPSSHHSKTPKPTLFSTFRARNGGAPNSSLNCDNTTTMDATPGGSDTEEEDNSAQEREYLDKMTDDTDRRVETVFGAGVDVWKSFGGTVYADVKESVKKKRRDEYMWGKKKANKGKARTKTSDSRSSSPPDDLYRDDEQGEHAPNQALNPPATPTQSEWEIFPVTNSQYDDIRVPLSFSPALHITPHIQEPSPAPVPQTLPNTTPTPIFPPRREKLTATTPSLYRPRTPTDTLFHRGSAGVDPLGNLNRPFRYTSVQVRREEADNGQPSTWVQRPRRVVSGSFGSFEGGRVGRFDERGYRLG
ncbi:hypothetical protein DDE82_007155 [Stemphylium lycopersici]|uniref:Uncharacterized protein n=1 Tax=Stemphylium lycopersici TaxID=183478 RepID=A0A364N104_STELY|nr:hypothetical protein TW65_90351 [Stemphylium lycopersici]RAR00585.1 hypothetical protein DDE82_007155 [Stemphylium lycopersici]RAR08695.1 hypothetical protein DDE83_005900 [Stemphylium lycopersici]